MASIKANFIGGKYDGKQLDVVLLDDWRPRPRIEYMEKHDPPILGIYRIAEQWTGSTPTYTFERVKLNA